MRWHFHLRWCFILHFRFRLDKTGVSSGRQRSHHHYYNCNDLWVGVGELTKGKEYRPAYISRYTMKMFHYFYILTNVFFTRKSPLPIVEGGGG